MDIFYWRTIGKVNIYHNIRIGGSRVEKHQGFMGFHRTVFYFFRNVTVSKVPYFFSAFHHFTSPFLKL